MAKQQAVIVLLALAALTAVHAAPVSCTYNGYDFSSMSGTDLTAVDTKGFSYIADLCSTAQETNCAKNGGSFCQYNSGNQYGHVLAKWDNSGVWSMCNNASLCPQGGVQVVYNNGDPCGVTPRQSTFVFACGSGNSNAYSVTEPPGSPCSYTAVFTNYLGCPAVPAGSSTGGAPPSPYVNCDNGNGGVNLQSVALMDHYATFGGYLWDLTVCGLSNETVCASKGGSFCQYSLANKQYQHVIAKWDTSAQFQACALADCPNGGVQLAFANGDMCGSAPRSATFRLHCDATNTFTIVNITEPTNPCAYIVDVLSTAACPVPPNNGGGGGSSGPTGGQIAGAVIGTLLGVALIGGVGYWYYRRRSSGDAYSGMTTDNTGGAGYQSTQP